MGTAQYPSFSTVLEHYGFANDPFGDLPDVRLFYPVATHLTTLK